MAFPPSARTWFDAELVSIQAVHERPSTQGEVFVVRGDDGRMWVVKTGSRAAIDREVWGLEIAGDGVPTLLARPEPTMLVLEWRPGAPSATEASTRAAGTWLRRLHSRSWADDDPLDVTDALLRRRDAWLSRARPNLDVSAVESLTFETFAGMKRVPCHRDFTPSNWLWDDDAGLSVIDFGQARPDLSCWDLVKLESETFIRRPELRAPFYDGYGAPAGELRPLVLLHGLQTAVWGDVHGDREFSALGREILARWNEGHGSTA